jgi:hypothetical protein
VTPQFCLGGFEYFVRRTRTRFPFRYGIASMTEVPHLFARVPVRVAGREVRGLASEGLPPKWFTKDPHTTFEQDLPAMLEVIGHAAELAEAIATKEVTFFTLWRELDRQQRDWAAKRGHAPLLAGLGVSLIERAVLDGLCRGLEMPLHRLVREDLLGLRLGEVYPELQDAAPRDLLPQQPLGSVLARHTVGLGDPITKDDIKAAEKMDDGLPQSLDQCIRAYGLRAFKIKLTGDAVRDLPRLRAIQALLEREVRGDSIVTLDGNENFKSCGAFREFWEQVLAEASLSGLLARVVVVEQPVHRDHALNQNEDLHSWPDRPLLIIDESDGAVGDLPLALARGYVGTSHKNCKGIVKGIANACLLAHRSKTDDRLVLTGEDLCNLGPVALLQDLAMMALLGISHVERNGHHYYRGLTPWPSGWQEAALAAHPDLYTRDEAGFVRVQIKAGRMDIHSLNTAPFGLGAELSVENLEQVKLSGR